MNTFSKFMATACTALLLTGNSQAQENPAYDYDFTPTIVCDTDWYGSRRSEGNHYLHNFYIVLGDKELSEQGTPQNLSTTYVFDIFGEGPENEMTQDPQPKVGTYILSDELKSGVLHTGSCVYIVDGNGNYEVDRQFTDGKLEISTFEKDGNTYYKYEADLTDELGKKHHVNFESRFISYFDNSQGGTSRLIKNLDFTLKNVNVNYKSVENGVMHVTIFMDTFGRDEDDRLIYDELPGVEMCVEAYMPFGKGLENGTYNVIDSGEAYTLQTGEIMQMAGGVEWPVGTYAQYVYWGQQAAWGCAKTGTMTVSGEGTNRKISMEYVTNEGFNVKFDFDGEIALSNFPQSGLTDNLELDLEGAEAVFDCVGDVEKHLHCRNWYIDILPTEGKDHGFHAYICTRTETFFDGIPSETYGPSPSREPWKDEYKKGSVNDKGQLSGTWMLSMFDENGQPQLNAPAYGGDLVITRHDDNQTYTVAFDMHDGAGHNFKGSWTGVPEMVNSCNDEQSGLSEIKTEADCSRRVYDLNGREVRGMDAPGVYIIRDNQGKATKHVVR